MKNDEIEDRFFVQGRMEILNLLNDLILRREVVSVNFNDGTEHFFTRLLEARGKVLVFDPGRNADVNLRLLKCRACSFIAHPDGIRVQFAGGPVRRISWGGSAALRVTLPERVARVQRQESFRVLIPSYQVLTAQVFSYTGAALGEWPVHDMSVGGLGITAEGHEQPELAQNIARVKLQLPEHGEIDCAVSLRHATGTASDECNPPYRIGLAFAGLPAEMWAAIQRYIIKTEHERRSRLRESGTDDQC